jgi:hypothetical protein
VGLPPPPVEFSSHHCFYKFSSPDCWACAAAPVSWHVCLQLTWQVGLPPSPVEFLPSATLTSFPTPDCWVHTASPALSGQAQLVYLQFQEGFPSPPLTLRTPHFATCLYCSYCLLLSFSFFPGWGSVCPGGYADLAQGCPWEYCVPLSSPCLHLPKLSACGRLVVAHGPSWFLCLT